MTAEAIARLAPFVRATCSSVKKASCVTEIESEIESGRERSSPAHASGVEPSYSITDSEPFRAPSAESAANASP